MFSDILSALSVTGFANLRALREFAQPYSLLAIDAKC